MFIYRIFKSFSIQANENLCDTFSQSAPTHWILQPIKILLKYLLLTFRLKFKEILPEKSCLILIFFRTKVIKKNKITNYGAQESLSFFTLQWKQFWRRLSHCFCFSLNLAFCLGFFSGNISVEQTRTEHRKMWRCFGQRKKSSRCRNLARAGKFLKTSKFLVQRV